ncbi:MAG: 3-isopropylmalate dehydratase large subunit [Candidatus Aerophobetes bacterium]|nr:3-isopropylmalate dehydratase large subunit [Candidatus Aerophobetes bacterium]
MGKTIAEKILSSHSGKDVRAGEIVICDIDFAMAQDGTAPLAIQAFQEMEKGKVFDNKKFALFIDHSAPSPNKRVSSLHTLMRNFAKKQGIKLYDIGEGVCHVVGAEEGWIVAGDLAVGADSHTCTYGALNAFSTGVGSTDLAGVLSSGKLWFKVPESIRIVCKAKLPSGVYAKDLALYLIGKLTSRGALYKSIEFGGETIRNLSMEARFTISNMAMEAGAKAGIMEGDEKTEKWLKHHSKREFQFVRPDDDASYDKVLEYDVSELTPQVARPHTVDNVTSIDNVEGIPIQQAFLGTCTNGRLEDLRIAAQILKNKKIHPGVRCIVAPGSRRIYLKALKEGIIEVFLTSGAALVTPGCGCCVGTHNGIPSSGENVISTANRNFKGRMGNPDAFIYLASPATVAASAIEGRITDPRKYTRERGRIKSPLPGKKVKSNV